MSQDHQCTSNGCSSDETDGAQDTDQFRANCAEIRATSAIPRMRHPGELCTSISGGARPKTSVLFTDSFEENAPSSEGSLVITSMQNSDLSGKKEEKLKTWKDAGIALKEALERLQQKKDMLCKGASECNVGKTEVTEPKTPHSLAIDSEPMNQMLAEYMSPLQRGYDTDKSTEPTSSMGNHHASRDHQSLHCITTQSVASGISNMDQKNDSSLLSRSCAAGDDTKTEDTQTNEPSLSELTQSLRQRLQQINANIPLGLRPCQKGGNVHHSNRVFATRCDEASTSNCDVGFLHKKPHKAGSRVRCAAKLKDPVDPAMNASRTSGSQINSFYTDTAMSDRACNIASLTASHVMPNTELHNPKMDIESVDPQHLPVEQRRGPKTLSSFHLGLSPDSSDDAFAGGAGLMPQAHLLKVDSSPRRKRSATAKSRRRSCEKALLFLQGQGESETDSADGTEGTSNRGYKPVGSLVLTDPLADLDHQADVESMYDEETDNGPCCQQSVDTDDAAEHSHNMPDWEHKEKETSVEKPLQLRNDSLASLCSDSEFSVSEHNMTTAPSELLPRTVSLTPPNIIISNGLEAHLCIEKYKKEKANTRLKRAMLSPEEEDKPADPDLSADESDSDLGDWSVPALVSDEPSDQSDVKITEAELDSLPDLASETDDSSSNDDADDEFECDCALCRLERSALTESSWVTEEEQEVIGGRVDSDLSEHFSDLHDGYNTSFDFSLSDLTIQSLLADGSRDLLEIMFQNVIMQMLAVYPDLLNEGAPPPLNSTDIDHIPTIRIGQSPSGEETTCPICLCPFEQAEEVKQLNCHHIFHTLCIKAWLGKSGTCPVCRQVVRVPYGGPELDPG